MWSTVRILSLDVVLGALASGVMAAAVLQVEMPLSWWVILPLSVWVVYTLDHLLDAMRLTGEAHTPRHQFHQRHLKSLQIVWGIAFAICVFVAPFWVPRPFLALAVGMGGLVILHLGLVWWVGDRISWVYHKELGVGGIYALGVWGGPAVLAPEINLADGLLFSQFFLLAMINLYTFSCYEIAIDELDGHSSFVRAIGVNRTQWLIKGLACLILLIGLIGWGMLELTPWAESIVFLMLGLLLLVSWRTEYFGQNERYRAWADGAFLIPMLGFIPYFL
ncbi:MAG: hypothetical protein AAFR61_26365 [Bacteroidota bacterium]